MWRVVGDRDMSTQRRECFVEWLNGKARGMTYDLCFTGFTGSLHRGTSHMKYMFYTRGQSTKFAAIGSLPLANHYLKGVELV